MDSDPKLDQWIRDKGVELEAAFQEAGSPLPGDVSGEVLIRAMLEQADEVARSPEGQAVSKRVEEVVRQVAAELPGGQRDPEFPNRVQSRLKEVFDKSQDGPNVSG